jgi:hypothetical protein
MTTSNIQIPLDYEGNLVLPSDDREWEWVPGKYGFWRGKLEQNALQALADAGMLPVVTLEELPA